MALADPELLRPLAQLFDDSTDDRRSVIARLLATVLDRPDWHRRAACRALGPDLFFPELGDNHSAAAARRICSACPVQAQCLEAALADPATHGMWSSTSMRQRALLRRTTAA